MSNLLRMGHCAPAVAQTLLDVTNAEGVWLVKLAAGLPGGIGNSESECGGLTAPLLMLGLRRLPLPCIKVVRFAPELLAETIINDTTLAIPSEEREAYRNLYTYQAERGFHCAHSVLRNLGNVIPITPELLDATSGFEIV